MTLFPKVLYAALSLGPAVFGFWPTKERQAQSPVYSLASEAGASQTATSGTSPSPSRTSNAIGNLVCAQLAVTGKPLPLPRNVPPKPGDNGWDERYEGHPVDLSRTSLAYCENFNSRFGGRGPILWARGHADVGLAKFDRAGGRAYSVRDGTLSLTAYRSSGEYRGGNVQSVSSTQAYNGAAIVPGERGFTCAGCYWEARIRFPRAYGTWGAFWLLTPDDPNNRGHLEVDGIEYYGLVDKRGHHHAVRRWKHGRSYQGHNDYRGMDAIADFGWHTYGIDLRGSARLNGKRALVIHFDGKEVSRLAAGDIYFSSPFYYLLSLTLNPKDKRWTVPQRMDVAWVRVYRPWNRGT